MTVIKRLPGPGQTRFFNNIFIRIMSELSKGDAKERSRKVAPAKKSAAGGVWPRVVAFVAMFCVLASLAVVHGGRLFGHGFTPSEEEATEVFRGDGEVINTTEIGKDIIGYGGPVPVEVYVTDGRVDSVVALPNNETKGFFAKLETGGLTHVWDGKTLAEVSAMEVDGISGATYSSRAYIANVKAAADYALKLDASSGASGAFDWTVMVALIVVLAGAVVPLFSKDKRYRLVQQVMNVAVLGFWTGTFIDYAMMLRFFENGASFTLASVMTVVLLVVGLLYPLFGHSNHYCAWICPYGALQDLAGRIPVRKLHLGVASVKFLDRLRRVLWIVLLLLLYLGWGSQWIDYEVFTGFIVESASWIVMAVGIVFVVLSVFVARPFCRFVCPTGSLLKEV